MTHERTSRSEVERELDRILKEFSQLVEEGVLPNSEELQARCRACKLETCPSCGSATVADIIYGFPAMWCPKLRKKLDERKVVLGGCCITNNDPAWHCTSCGLDIDGPPLSLLFAINEPTLPPPDI